MSAPEPDLVSVVIPTRNRRDSLRAAIASVKQQTWPRIELIVVDDASSDGTPQMLQSMAAEDRNLHVIRNDAPHGGAGARNQGIEIASGQWLAFLDDDDTWLPTKLDRQLSALKARPGASAASCAYFYRTPLRGERIVHAPAAATEQQMLSGNPMGGASVCVTSRKTMTALGGFDGSLRSGQDWDLWLRLFFAGPIVVCEEPLVRYDSHLGQRITNDLASVYAGRRRIYFRYRRLMTAETRKRNTALLLYRRACLEHVSLRRRLYHLRRVLHLSGIRTGLMYVLWFMRARLLLGGR